MNKILLLIPLILILNGCGVQPAPAQDAATQDLAAIVNATLTAMAQSVTLQPATPAPQPTATAIPSPESRAPTLSADLLRNGTYKTQDWGEFQLVDGVYYHNPPTAQESPEAYTTHMLDTILYGDINMDGVEDAVVFLTTQSGGTGHFVEMAAVLDQDGSASNAATRYLGDRVVVESGTIQDGLITLNMRVQGPNDGMCCPSQSATWTFRLQEGNLIQVS